MKTLGVLAICALIVVVALRVAAADWIYKRWLGFPVYFVAMSVAAISAIVFVITLAEAAKHMFQ